MSIEIDPDMLEILEAMRATPPIDYMAMPIGKARQVFEAGMAPWTALGPQNLVTDDLTLPGVTGPMRARLYRPVADKLPLILFVHGGGWTFGSVSSHANEMRYLALASGCAVLGFDYRLAPEFPFPAPLDDVLAAIGAVRAGALGELADAGRLALAGDSAGANLALGSLLALRDAGEPLPAAAGLFYGCYARAFDGESHRRFGDGSFGLPTARMRWYWSNFLGEAEDAPPALAAPLDADLTGLPPLYLMAAGLDSLQDDTLALAERLEAAGVTHELSVAPGVIHGFLGRAPRLPAARSALAGAGAFLAGNLGK
jgi:acetyl esterase/lipase